MVELVVELGPPHRVQGRDDPTRQVRYHHSWIAGMQRPYLLSDAGYHIVTFVVMGSILGAWS